MQKYRDAALAEAPTATGDRLQQLIDKYTPDPLKQIVNIASAYVQNEWKSEQWSFLIGGRLDKNSIMSKAIFKVSRRLPLPSDSKTRAIIASVSGRNITRLPANI